MEKKEKTIDEIFAALEEVLTSLESEEISLEDSFQRYESGIKLIKSCNEKIEQVEKQIMVLSENGGDHDF